MSEFISSDINYRNYIQIINHKNRIFFKAKINKGLISLLLRYHGLFFYIFFTTLLQIQAIHKYRKISNL